MMVLITADWGAELGRALWKGNHWNGWKHASGEETRDKCGQHFQFCYQGNRGPVLEQVMELKDSDCLFAICF